MEHYEAEIKKLKEHRFAYDKEVWSPVELLRILDNHDLNWNGVCKEVEKLKEENKKLKKGNKKYHMECLKLNRELSDWHGALNEDIGGLEHLQSEINLHFWKRCHGPWDADIEKIKR